MTNNANIVKSYLHYDELTSNGVPFTRMAIVWVFEEGVDHDYPNQGRGMLSESEVSSGLDELVKCGSVQHLGGDTYRLARTITITPV